MAISPAPPIVIALSRARTLGYRSVASGQAGTVRKSCAPSARVAS